jgi:hypothetical protein
VHVFRAATADHAGLAPPHGPPGQPRGSLASAWRGEVGALAAMGPLTGHLRVTALAALGEAPAAQRVTPGASQDRGEVGEDSRALPSERAPAEAGDPWLPSPLALDRDLQARARPSRGLERRLGRSRPRHDGGARLAGQRLQPCGRHDPRACAQAEDLLGPTIVLDESPVLGLGRCDHRDVGVVQPCAALGRFPRPPGARAAWLVAGVISVWDADRSRVSGSRRNARIRDVSAWASGVGPAHPSRQSSADRTSRRRRSCGACGS